MNPDMYHHSLILATHLGPARALAAVAAAVAAAACTLAARSLRRAGHHT
jgi:hypothetical protein